MVRNISCTYVGIKYLFIENHPPPRKPEEAFDSYDELRTVEEMRDVLADRHRVKLNSLIGKAIRT